MLTHFFSSGFLGFFKGVKLMQVDQPFFPWFFFAHKGFAFLDYLFFFRTIYLSLRFWRLILINRGYSLFFVDNPFIALVVRRSIVMLGPSGSPSGGWASNYIFRMDNENLDKRGVLWRVPLCDAVSLDGVDFLADFSSSFEIYNNVPFFKRVPGISLSLVSFGTSRWSSAATADLLLPVVLGSLPVFFFRLFWHYSRKFLLEKNKI